MPRKGNVFTEKKRFVTDFVEPSEKKPKLQYSYFNALNSKHYYKICFPQFKYNYALKYKISFNLKNLEKSKYPCFSKQVTLLTSNKVCVFFVFDIL